LVRSTPETTPPQAGVTGVTVIVEVMVAMFLLRFGISARAADPFPGTLIQRHVDIKLSMRLLLDRGGDAAHKIPTTAPAGFVDGRNGRALG
jgi:hypothetical protein